MSAVSMHLKVTAAVILWVLLIMEIIEIIENRASQGNSCNDKTKLAKLLHRELDAYIYHDLY